MSTQSTTSTVNTSRTFKQKWQHGMWYIYRFFGGVTEFYAFIFTVFLIEMAFKNILSATFIAGIGAIQAFVTANDIHNDLNGDGIPDDQQTEVNVTVTK